MIEHPIDVPLSLGHGREVPSDGAHDQHSVYDVIVVGAGAAGLIAAGRAAELGGKVLLLEKMERAGRKILISGKGRCNITNDAPIDEFLKRIHSNNRFLRHAFSTFFSKDIIQLLKDHGCDTAVERGGRVFPVSNKAADVVHALMHWLDQNPIEIRYGHRVEEFLVTAGELTGLKVRSTKGTRIIHARNVICCTGGMSYPATGSSGDGYRMASALGHTVETPRQALVPLETGGDIAQRMAGLSLRNVKAMVWVNGRKLKEAFGEMLFTEFGISGPIVLSLSRLVVDELRKHHHVEVSIDLKPALDEAKLDLRLVRDLAEYGKQPMASIFRKWLPAAMIPVMLDLTVINGRKAGHQLTSSERRNTLRLMKDLRLAVTGCRPFKEAIITAGGLVTSEIHPSTMESKLVPKLYFAGELLDVDADTGGFNLQIAFSTGWLAAESAMRPR